MLKPTGFLRNQVSEEELGRLVKMAATCGVVAYLPFAIIYPFMLGPQVVDPFWERLVLALFAASGFLLPRYPQTRIWMQTYVYVLCFLFTGHLFTLVCRNDLHMAYQMGYVCMIAVIAFYLDTALIFALYAGFNALLLALSLLFQISQDSFFFATVILSILGVNWVALYSRLRIMRSLEESRAALQEKNQKIQSILENIQQGVVTVEYADGRIGAECSAFLYQLLGDPQHRPIRNVRDILAYTRLPQDQVEQILAAIACIIQENDIAFAANYHLLPRRLVEGKGANLRCLEIDWNPVYHTDGLVRQLLVCIRDVTELYRLRQDAAQGQQDLTMLAELVNIPREHLHSVLDASEDILERLRLTPGTSTASIMRLLHTLKGNARSYGLASLAEAAHECETLVVQGHAFDPTGMAPLDALLQQYRSIAENKLGHQGQCADQITVPRVLMKAAAAALDRIPHHERHALQPVYEILRGAMEVTMEQVLAPHLASLPQLAAELGKRPPKVQIVDPGVHLHEDSAALLGSIFLHLLRNSVDHGIETDKDGHISIVLKNRVDGLDILMQDNGRGLNLETIRRRALEQGLITADAELKNDELASLIFRPGFTTRTRLTNVSGRGVGLDAVRSLLDEAGGHIRLVLDDVQPSGYATFTLVLHLPSHLMAQRICLIA